MVSGFYELRMAVCIGCQVSKDKQLANKSNQALQFVITKVWILLQVISER